MKLGELMRDLLELDPAWAGLDVHDVTEDSRAIEPGDLFVAIRGLTVDGHDYARQAAHAGAAAVVAARPLALPVPCLVVDDPARALALSTARLAGEPARRMELIGVTGTNGKTTTTYLVEAILAAAGHVPGVVGTVAYRYGGTTETAPFTTPTPRVLHDVLGRMAGAGCSHVVMEVSSHALEMGRVWGIEPAVAGFTHLTQDHLDLHGSMERYLRAKLLLFSRHLRPGGTAVVNIDGAGAEEVIQTVHARPDLRLLTCATSGRPADAVLRGADYGMNGLRATLEIEGREVPIRSPMLGAFNGDNILMAATLAHAAGVELETIAAGVARVAGVPGRLQRINPDGDFAVLVDYAHTPDALQRAMAVLRPICTGRLIVVFGCGGDRDRTKRPIMGRAVAEQADLAVVTSDNPRTEEPLSIIEAVTEGVRSGSLEPASSLQARRGYVVEPDRRVAIAAAVQAARAGDIVLIAGKGHEDYQILGTERVHFDDREQAREALAHR